MILVVDDEQELARNLVRGLKHQLDQPLHYALTWEEALAIARANSADLRLILLDIHMPVCDGRMLGAQLRRIAPHTPILPVTGDLTEPAAATLRQMGCLEPLFKPFTYDQIIERIQQALETTPPPLPPDPWFQTMLDQIKTLEAAAQRTPRLMAAMCDMARADSQVWAVPETEILQLAEHAEKAIQSMQHRPNKHVLRMGAILNYLRFGRNSVPKV